MSQNNKEEIKQASLANIFIYWERQYKKEKGKKKIKNSLYAWAALKACFEFNVPVPEWVQDYFSEAATKLLSIAKEREAGDKEKTAVWIQDALSLNPGPGRESSLFKDYRRHWRNQMIFHKVNEKVIKKECNSLTEAYMEVADEMDFRDTSQVKRI